ncbi:MAG: site-specific DNA-methyltransferase [Sphingomonas sp.]|uniref:site-specific DNA-methyltransferase n=1 Tax=Sphingomonas sp. TaxID=28214 RepID=UPI0035A8D337|nr:site-specific DNA-methyltransferase [Sphingomonas sp.]
MTNRLYYGDNLDVLRQHIADESVDLIYLDPPFNSNASYNILFKSPAGAGADASIEAFDDTWAWGPSASEALMDITASGNHKLHVLMQAMKTAIGENAMMAYLAMMVVRLQELHRVLKPTGSLYLHCDPTASHYLKLVLDAVFGPEQFLNEITWKRTFAHSGARRFGPVHDTILFYSKNGHNRWQDLKVGHDDAYVTKHFRAIDEETGERFQAISLTGAGTRKGESGQPWRGVDPTIVGRHWAVPRAILAKEDLEAQGTIAALEALDKAGRIYWPSKEGGTPRLKWFVSDLEGARLGDVWTDIPPISAQAKERLGYPTQKPRALLERIIAASSNPGDVVLDPFCGCGTAVDAAQKLGRGWIGIDITHLAIGLIEKRMNEGYNGGGKREALWETIGSPRDLASAQRLALDDPHQFQHWITLKLGGYPWMGGKKGGDKGVDGYFYYVGDGGQTETGVISVKAGNNVNPGMVRDLGRVMARDGHKLGLFVCAALPTKGMTDEAASHGLIETDWGRFPALQTFTLAELFQDRAPKLPPLVSPNRKAPRVETRASHQTGAQDKLL